MFIHEILKALRKFGIRVGELKPYRGTITKFCRTHPKGTYYMDMHSHAAVVQDGIIYDNSWQFGLTPRRWPWRKMKLDNYAVIS